MQLEERVASRALTVTELTSIIKDTLEGYVGEVWVVGEISNFKAAPSGHVYFTLKDENSQIAVVMFRRHAAALPFLPADGQEVLVRGQVSLYAARGNLQLYAELVEPRGVGALQVAFERLKAKLAAEGLFASERKRPLPPFPRCVGIVTAPRGAAIHDMLSILFARFPRLRVVIRPVRVQGVEAAAEIAEAVGDLNRLGGVDVMIVGRGGGSLEDLWPFNEEIVARAIAASEVPVVSAVGHEVDYTIADFVADKRAPTPTAAAEMVVPSYEEVTRQLEESAAALGRAMERRTGLFAQRLDDLSSRLRDPRRRLEELRQRLEELGWRAIAGARRVVKTMEERAGGAARLLRARDPRALVERERRAVESWRQRLVLAGRRFPKERREILKGARERLLGLSPMAVLSRGYAIVKQLPRNAIVRDAREIATGDRLQVTFARGSALARVERSEPGGGPLDEQEEGRG